MAKTHEGWQTLLNERKITMRDLAKQSGASYSVVKKVCCGKYIHATEVLELRAIARSLGLKLADLPDWKVEIF